MRARSAEGLSAAAFELESWGLLVHAAYGAVSRLPFSSYGEAAILLAQNLLLLALVYRYAGTSVARVGGVFGVLAAAVAVLASGARAACVVEAEERQDESEREETDGQWDATPCIFAARP